MNKDLLKLTMDGTLLDFIENAFALDPKPSALVLLLSLDEKSLMPMVNISTKVAEYMVNRDAYFEFGRGVITPEDMMKRPAAMVIDAETFAKKETLYENVKELSGVLENFGTMRNAHLRISLDLKKPEQN